MTRDLLPSYLRRWRQAKGYSQEAVAAALGIDRTVVVKWERGSKRPPLERLFDLSDLYDVPVGRLLGDPDDAADYGVDFTGTDVTREELRAVVEAYMAARKKSAP